MADKIFNHYSHLTGDPGMDVQAAITAGELGVLLVMTGWTFATYKDVTNLGALALGTYEYDGTGYTRKALVNASWDKNPTLNRSEITADPTTWPALGQGANPAVGSVLYWDEGLTGNDALIVPVSFWDGGGFPKDGTGLEFRITWDAGGLYYHGTA